MLQLFDESIAGQTWVARALNRVELPPIERPWPAELQSGLPSDFCCWLPDAISGEIAAGEAFVALSEALEKAELPPPPPLPPPVRFDHLCSHVPVSFTIPAGTAVTLYSADRNRGYSLVVNTGANSATIAYGRDATATDLPLASGGDGFHELIFGTTSMCSVFSAAGTTVVLIDGAFDPARSS